jgi:diguanylate cyclase (GGDEF)-like protein/PAS domain S-box-containing protein
LARVQVSAATATPASPIQLHLEGALALVSDGVIAVDSSGRIAFLNTAAQTLIRASQEAAVGMPLAQLLGIVDVQSGGTITDALDDASGASSGPGGARNAVLINGADNPIIIEYTVSVIRGSGGEVTGAVVVFRDIMQRRTAEQALRSSEAALLENATALFEEKERAQVTLNSIADAVVSTDFRGRVTFLNNIAEKMCGWNQAEAVGRMLDEIFFLVDSNTRKHMTCPAMQAIIEDRMIASQAPAALIRRDGGEISVENRVSPIHDRNGGVAGAVMVVHDVTAAREAARKLARLAMHDTLTGLPNRNVLIDRLNLAIERANRYQQVLSVLFIDLDKFKPVNDSLGHACGDALLKVVAQRLLGCVRSSDTVCRYGGDEFVVLLPDISHEDDARHCAGKIIAAMERPFDVSGHRVRIGASIGIANWPGTARDAETLIKCADQAMYRAKLVADAVPAVSIENSEASEDQPGL